ncbi:MAG TPA: sporulation integral membrane protein YlbJ, partial [Syntrophothermus lipocalidus]|nr:sporulation integral membrane protein YlbJ [Syntrophothermus lipocalidus]
MSYWYVPFGIIVTVLLAGFMIINPTLTIKSAADGIDLWFRLVLPALFPFFVASELLVQFGFVRLLGWLLEPITRPFFRLPGASSFVIVMGFTSGFPVGAFLTRRLLEEKLLNIKEAERLVSFTNNASPLFILGTVAVGMFGLPEAGYILAGSHYLANLTVGFIWGRMASDSSEKSNSTGPQHQDRQASLLQVLRACQNSHTSIGKIMGDSIRKAIASVVGVGGFIVMFSVITRMLQALGFIDLIAKFLQQAAVGLHLPYSLAYGLSIGLF